MPDCIAKLPSQPAQCSLFVTKWYAIPSCKIETNDITNHKQYKVWLRQQPDKVQKSRETEGNRLLRQGSWRKNKILRHFMFCACSPSTVPCNVCNPQNTHWGVIVTMRWLHERFQGRERAGTEIDYNRRKYREGSNGQTDRKKTKTKNKEKTKSDLGVSENKGGAVWAEWSSQYDGGGSEELNSETAMFPDIEYILHNECPENTIAAGSCLASWNDSPRAS